MYPRNSRSHGKEEARRPVGSTDGALRRLIMKKWIITRGAGFIGCYAAARLDAAGDRVVLVNNLSRRAAEVNLAWLRARGVTDFVWADIRKA
jgi:Ketopantoate reductase PanE/ApbA